jgi:type VI protein secretion system component Hcp
MIAMNQFSGPVLRVLRAAVMLFCVALAASPNEARAMSGVFMKVEGVEAWLPVAAASSEFRPATASAPAATTVVRVAKFADQGTPILVQACGGGAVVKRVTLAWRDNDGTRFRITLDGVSVESMSVTREPGPEPRVLEEYTMQCRMVEWSWFAGDGAEATTGGDGLRFDAAIQSATVRRHVPFRARLESGGGPGHPLRLTFPVERGRTYRILASAALDGRWESIERFTAAEDGEIQREISTEPGRLFLRVEALD